MNTSMKIDRFYMKTRNMRYTSERAKNLGIKKIYNYTSDLGFMDMDELSVWVKNVYDPGRGESVLVESALKTVSGVTLYVMSCVVFDRVESCNLYFIRNWEMFKCNDGFYHLLN